MLVNRVGSMPSRAENGNSSPERGTSVDAERAAFIIATSLEATSVPALSADPKCVQSKNKKRLRYILVLFLFFFGKIVAVLIWPCHAGYRVGFMPSPTENVHSSRERGI